MASAKSRLYPFADGHNLSAKDVASIGSGRKSTDSDDSRRIPGPKISVGAPIMGKGNGPRTASHTRLGSIFGTTGLRKASGMMRRSGSLSSPTQKANPMSNQKY